MLVSPMTNTYFCMLNETHDNNQIHIYNRVNNVGERTTMNTIHDRRYWSIQQTHLIYTRLFQER